MRKPLIVLAVLCFIPSWASEPGQPLDCGDWVILEPGYSCTNFARPCEGSNACGPFGSERVVGNDGEIIYLRISQLGFCSCPGIPRFLLQLVVQLLQIPSHLIPFVTPEQELADVRPGERKEHVVDELDRRGGPLDIQEDGPDAGGFQGVRHGCTGGSAGRSPGPRQTVS